MNIAFAAASVLHITDAMNRVAVLTYLRCPLGCAGLILKLNALPPVHLGTLVLGQLCDGLRAGPAWVPLQDSPAAPGVRLAVIRRPGGDEHFMLGYTQERPQIAWFTASGGAPDEKGFRSSIALDAGFRKRLADMLTAELVADRPAEARA